MRPDNAEKASLPNRTPRAGLELATVLVVDDEARNRALVKGYLEPEHRVLEADGRSAALEILASEKVDLVLLDVMMPGASGFDVCREIKAGSSGPFLPVLLLTALSEQGDRNVGLEAGADDFITKPFDGTELRLRVRTFLRLRTQEALIKEQLENLRQLGDLKDDLVSVIVHDLRNPLAGILAMVFAIKEDATDPALIADLDVTLHAGRQIRDAVDDMLQVRLMEEGQLVLQKEMRAVREVVREALSTMEPVAKERNVGLVLAGGTDATVALDAKLTRRAIENLVANAVRYSRGGGVVDVGVTDVPDGVRIDISDRGPGIPETAKAGLFQKFGSVEAKRGEPRRGFGLGLYFVKLVAVAHGGRVEAHDRDGGGTEMRVFLPGKRG